MLKKTARLVHRGFPYILFAGTIALIAYLSLLLLRSLKELGSGKRGVARGTNCVIIVKCSVCICFCMCDDLYVCVCMFVCVFAYVCMYLHALLSLCTLVVRRQQVQRRHQWCSAKWAVVSERLKLLRMTRVWESLTFLKTSS